MCLRAADGGGGRAVLARLRRRALRPHQASSVTSDRPLFPETNRTLVTVRTALQAPPRTNPRTPAGSHPPPYPHLAVIPPQGSISHAPWLPRQRGLRHWRRKRQRARWEALNSACVCVCVFTDKVINDQHAALLFSSRCGKRAKLASFPFPRDVQDLTIDPKSL